eukprot:15441758-Alexandrium_andersonii.AAC.1
MGAAAGAAAGTYGSFCGRPAAREGSWNNCVALRRRPLAMAPAQLLRPSSAFSAPLGVWTPRLS